MEALPVDALNTLSGSLDRVDSARRMDAFVERLAAARGDEKQVNAIQRRLLAGVGAAEASGTVDDLLDMGGL